jgi:hypothetical protein
MKFIPDGSVDDNSEAPVIENLAEKLSEISGIY